MPRMFVTFEDKLRDLLSRVTMLERLVGRAGSSSSGIGGGGHAPGDLKMSVSSRVPTGWLLCMGQEVPKSLYPALYDAIGGRFGETIDTFTLPDLQGRMPIGVADGISPYSTIGNKGGESTHTLTPSEMPAHTHLLESGGRAHSFAWGITVPSNVYAQNAIAVGGNTPSNNLTTSQNNWNKTAPAGDGVPHNNMPPYIVVNYLVKT